MMGHQVFTAYDIAQAREYLDDANNHVHVVIADHRLPDGLGIDFVIGLRPQIPDAYFAIVSGVLTERDMARLEIEEIPYFHKPLLYRKVIDEVCKEVLKTRPVGQNGDPCAEPGSGATEGEAGVGQPRGGGNGTDSKVPLWKRIFGGKK